MVDTSILTGSDRDALSSFCTLDVMVAENSIVLLPFVESGRTSRMSLSSRSKSMESIRSASSRTR